MSDSSLTATAKAADRLQHEEKRYNVFYLKFSNKDATSRISMKNIMASENVTGKQVYRREWVFFSDSTVQIVLQHFLFLYLSLSCFFFPLFLNMNILLFIYTQLFHLSIKLFTLVLRGIENTKWEKVRTGAKKQNKHILLYIETHKHCRDCSLKSLLFIVA